MKPCGYMYIEVGPECDFGSTLSRHVDMMSACLHLSECCSLVNNMTVNVYSRRMISKQGITVCFVLDRTH